MQNQLEQTLDSREVAEMIGKDQIKIDVVIKVLDILGYMNYIIFRATESGVKK